MEVNGYQIVKRIAVGGMAEVYLAVKEGVGGFKRRFILKKLLPAYTEDPSFVEMFYNEAILVSHLNHPNIVQVYDVIRDNFDVYIAMEYVDGPNLSMVIRDMREKNHPMPYPIAARIIADVAHALHYAYTAKDEEGRPLKIIHRDVTPSNIMINKTGVVKLVDFGIASASFTDDSAFEGYVKGKPAYMAPELFKNREATHKTDIFALGVILFEVTTGHRLFKRKTLESTLRAVLKCRVPSPSKLVPDYPKELEEIIFKSVTPDPKDRYESAELMARDLEEYIIASGERVGNEEVKAFISTIVEGKGGKSFEEMTLEDFIERPTDGSITDNARIAGIVDTGSSSDKYEDTDIDRVINQIVGKNDSARSKSYMMWLNGFLVALVIMAIGGYFLIRSLNQKRNTAVNAHKEVKSESKAFVKKEKPEVFLRYPMWEDQVQYQQRRPYIFFVAAQIKKGEKTGTLLVRANEQVALKVDGKVVGKGKRFSLVLKTGKHVVIVKGKKVKRIKKVIKIKEGKSKRVVFNIKPIKPVGTGMGQFAKAEKKAEKVSANKLNASSEKGGQPEAQQGNAFKNVVEKGEQAGANVNEKATKLAANAGVQPNKQQEKKEVKPPSPPKKVPHLGFVMSPLRQTALILKVLAHDRGKFSSRSSIKVGILYDDDPFSKKKADQMFTAMKRLAGRSFDGKSESPVKIMVTDRTELINKLRSAGVSLVYISPMDHKDVRIALSAARSAHAATVTGVGGYQRVGVCLSLKRVNNSFRLVINKSRCHAEGVRFDEKILELSEVY